MAGLRAGLANPRTRVKSLTIHDESHEMVGNPRHDALTLQMRPLTAAPRYVFCPANHVEKNNAFL